MGIFGQADTLSEFLGIEEYEPDCTCEDAEAGKLDPTCYWHGEQSGYDGEAE